MRNHFYQSTGARMLAGGWLVQAVVCLTACNHDVRLTVHEYEDIEDNLNAERATQVGDVTRLGLTDFAQDTVRPGDVLTLTLIGPATRVMPSGDPALASSLRISDPYTQSVVRVRVNDDGAIQLPLAGTVQVGGLTLKGVERAVVEAHVPRFVKELSVFAELTENGGTTVVIIPAGDLPRLVPLRGNERNVLYALQRAGLLPNRSSGKVKVFPVNSADDPVAYDLSRPEDLRRAMIAPPLNSGDMVIVKTAPNSAVYVMGLVNQPGPIPVPPGSETTLVRAIAAAGGLIDLLEPKCATLYRWLSNGEQVRIRVDLADVKAGKTEDIVLREDDVIEIPHTADTRFRQWFAANVGIGPFRVGVNYDPLAQYNINRALRQADDDDDFGDAVRDSLRFSVPQLVVPPVVQTPAP